MKLHLLPFFACTTLVACERNNEPNNILANSSAKWGIERQSPPKIQDAGADKNDQQVSKPESTKRSAEEEIETREELASFSTKFPYDESNASRAHNIKLAVYRLTGTILLPRTEFSFNQRIGERTPDAGFREAIVLFGGQKLPGIGGGICQVSSTLYAAAMFGGLDVKRRTSHSRQSDYIPRGLDSTVDYGKLDLVFINPYDVPLKILAEIPEPGVLEIKIVGIEKNFKVKHFHKTGKTEPYSQRVIRGKYHRGPPKKKQKGKDGMPGVSYWVYRDKATGEKKTIRTESKYKPVPEIWYANNVDDVPGDSDGKTQGLDNDPSQRKIQRASLSVDGGSSI